MKYLDFPPVPTNLCMVDRYNCAMAVCSLQGSLPAIREIADRCSVVSRKREKIMKGLVILQSKNLGPIVGIKHTAATLQIVPSRILNRRLLHILTPGIAADTVANRKSKRFDLCRLSTARTCSSAS
jgi:hypothetical protein